MLSTRKIFKCLVREQKVHKMTQIECNASPFTIASPYLETIADGQVLKSPAVRHFACDMVPKV